MLRAAGRAAPRPRGFTLIELMVVVSIIAVAASLAAPGAVQMIATRRVQTTAQSILDGINTARVEAVRRNAPVRFALAADGKGWTLRNESSLETLRTFSSSDWSSVLVEPLDGLSAVVFLPNGMRMGGAQLSQVTVSSPVENAGTRRINVFGGGLIRMCDPAVVAAADPRRC